MDLRLAAEITAGDLLIITTLDGPSPERVVAATPWCLAALSESPEPTHIEIVLEDGSVRQLMVDEAVVILVAALVA